jgi:hypothetical protein
MFTVDKVSVRMETTVHAHVHEHVHDHVNDSRRIVVTRARVVTVNVLVNVNVIVFGFFGCGNCERPLTFRGN